MLKAFQFELSFVDFLDRSFPTFNSDPVGIKTPPRTFRCAVRQLTVAEHYISEVINPRALSENFKTQ